MVKHFPWVEPGHQPDWLDPERDLGRASYSLRHSYNYWSCIMRAVPGWSNRVEMREIYAWGERLRQMGLDVEVDHIVPLNSDIVCGLHCPDNMQILLRPANQRKSNTWWPDHPFENLDLFDD